MTVTLDEETFSQARVRAAEQNASLSRFIGEVLRKHMRGDDEYERAMRRFLSRKPQALLRPGERLFTREEVHDRAALRKMDEAERKKGRRS